MELVTIWEELELLGQLFTIKIGSFATGEQYIERWNPWWMISTWRKGWFQTDWEHTLSFEDSINALTESSKACRVLEKASPLRKALAAMTGNREDGGKAGSSKVWWAICKGRRHLQTNCYFNKNGANFKSELLAEKEAKNPAHPATHHRN
jgi:hypothetical protein